MSQNFLLSRCVKSYFCIRAVKSILGLSRPGSSHTLFDNGRGTNVDISFHEMLLSAFVRAILGLFPLHRNVGTTCETGLYETRTVSPSNLTVSISYE
jgi:hypothetical protein